MGKKSYQECSLRELCSFAPSIIKLFPDSHSFKDWGVESSKINIVCCDLDLERITKYPTYLEVDFICSCIRCLLKKIQAYEIKVDFYVLVLM